MKIDRRTVVFVEVLLLALALVLFGKSFTKFSVWGVLHLYDLLLLLLVGQILYFKQKLEVDWILISLFVISLIYLFLSILRGESPGFIIRQYALFWYALASYTIVSFLAPQKGWMIQMLKAIGLFSCFAQIIYMSLTEPQHYNYLSPASIVGVLMTLSFILVFCESVAIKVILAIGCFILLEASGHSSALLAGLSAIMMYAVSLLDQRMKKILLISFVVLCPILYMAFMYYYHNVADNNAIWRFVYWHYVLEQLITEKLGVFGFGFGGKYASYELAYLLEVDMGFSTHMLQPAEAASSPPHNSFLTIAYHIGLLPCVVLCAYLFRPVLFLGVVSPVKAGNDSVFLSLTVLSVAVWSAFNVILELPHSSMLFWIPAFLLLVEWKKKASGLTLETS